VISGHKSHSKCDSNALIGQIWDNPEAIKSVMDVIVPALLFCQIMAKHIISKIQMGNQVANICPETVGVTSTWRGSQQELSSLDRG
jgi:hypothetical protein